MKILCQPVSPFVINQFFGENKACVSTDGKNTFITCDGLNPPIGFRSIYDHRGHLGLDLSIYHSQPIYCVLDGVVDFIDTDKKSGLDVRIISEKNGRTFKHIYEHLLGHQVVKGQKVKTGELVGWGNNTGWSSGDHLHFQVEELINGAWTPIDPIPLMDELFALDARKLEDQLGFLKEKLAVFADLLADFLRK